MTGFLVTSIVPAKAAEEGAGQGMELGAPFADHAVLQRGMPVPVWGWSKTGMEVTVEFAGQKKQAKAGGPKAEVDHIYELAPTYAEQLVGFRHDKSLHNSDNLPIWQLAVKR